MKTETPWGAAQNSRAIAEGITFHSTAGHGGIELSPERWADLEAALPGFTPWAGAGWLEEDCDSTAAVLLWPEFFEEEQAFHAVRFARRPDDSGCDEASNEKAYAAFFQTARAAEVVRRAEAFGAGVAGKWERGGGCTGGHGWTIFLRRGKETRTVWVKKDPGQNFFTDEELDALPAEPKEELCRR